MLTLASSRAAAQELAGTTGIFRENLIGGVIENGTYRPETAREALSEEAAYAWCARLAREHYENFPVGSLLVPRRLRRHVVAVYAFARIADDLADEETASADERLAALDDWERGLRAAFEGRAEHPAFVAIAASARDVGLPAAPLHALLAAFRHDAKGGGCGTIENLLAYCRNSANPVGRLLLHLFGIDGDDRLGWSDDLCTALQIANFLQDLSIDLPRRRVNVPRALLTDAGVDPDGSDLASAGDRVGTAIAPLIALADERFRSGLGLLAAVPDRRLRLELRATWLGGTAILARVRALGPRIVHTRPSLDRRAKAGLVLRALTGAPHAAAHPP